MSVLMPEAARARAVAYFRPPPQWCPYVVADPCELLKPFLLSSFYSDIGLLTLPPVRTQRLIPTVPPLHPPFFLRFGTRLTFSPSRLVGLTEEER